MWWCYVGKYLRVDGFFFVVLFSLFFKQNKAAVAEGSGRRKGRCCSRLSGDERHHEGRQLFVICHCFVILKNVVKEVAGVVRVERLGGREPFSTWVLEVTCFCCALMSMVQFARKKKKKEKSCLMSPGLSMEKIAKLLREIRAKYVIYSKGCRCM